MIDGDSHVPALYDDLLRAVAEGGRKVVVWGVNTATLKLLTLLREGTMIRMVKALIDTRPEIRERVICGVPVRSPEEVYKEEFDTLLIASDEEKQDALEAFARVDNRLPRVVLAGDAHYGFSDPVFDAIVASCSVRSKAGGYPNMLIHLYQSLTYIAQRRLTGDVAEFGAYRGGTTVFMAKVLAALGHPARIYGFDTFSGFPGARSVFDVFQDPDYSHVDYDEVHAYCSGYNIELVRGDICETFRRLKGMPLVLTFFDTDNYSPTRAALEMCIAQTVPGGIIACDHYYSPGWARTIGERIAATQVLSRSTFFHLHGTGIFVKY
ncbi:MAG: TylF/MycF/NovP-related O-methyltransferase [Gemmatimonadales bacterium]|jgi:predicted O-methyltransferase YrrM